MSLYIAAYDISNDRRRAQVAEALGRYGHRVQESVFEVWLDGEDYAVIRFQVGALLGVEDSCDFYPVDERGARRRARWRREVGDWDGVVIL